MQEQGWCSDFPSLLYILKESGKITDQNRCDPIPSRVSMTIRWQPPWHAVGVPMAHPTIVPPCRGERHQPLEKAGREGLKKATFPQTVRKS